LFGVDVGGGSGMRIAPRSVVFVNVAAQSSRRGTIKISASRFALLGVSLLHFHSKNPKPDPIAFERNGTGRTVVDSSFHHFLDYNLDPRAGCPCLVTEPVVQGCWIILKLLPTSRRTSKT